MTLMMQVADLYVGALEKLEKVSSSMMSTVTTEYIQTVHVIHVSKVHRLQPHVFLKLLLPNVAMTWDCGLYHYHLLLVEHHNIWLISHQHLVGDQLLSITLRGVAHFDPGTSSPCVQPLLVLS